MSNDILNSQGRGMDNDVSGKEDVARREALKKIGKFAAYTAPALLVLLSAKTSDALCNPNPQHTLCVGNCTPAAVPPNC